MLIRQVGWDGDEPGQDRLRHFHACEQTLAGLRVIDQSLCRLIDGAGSVPTQSIVARDAVKMNCFAEAYREQKAETRSKSAFCKCCFAATRTATIRRSLPFVTLLACQLISIFQDSTLTARFVSTSKGYIGKLVDIMWCPANDIYIIKNHEKEYLIPVVDEFIKKINYKNKEIVISTIDGLIE